jgi:AcrR family transcriptional regulator
MTSSENSKTPADWRDFSDDGLNPMLRAARELFARHGYHATSIRSIAKLAGLSVPGLYHHYESKQAILDALVSTGIALMLAHTQAADRESDGTAIGRFNNVIDCLLRYHMFRRDEAFIASSEMRSMEPDVRRRHVAARDVQQNMITDIIQQGIAEGTFHCRHPKETARAVSSLCVSVSSWYRPDGPLSIDTIAERYLDIARRAAGFRN